MEFDVVLLILDGILRKRNLANTWRNTGSWVLQGAHLLVQNQGVDWQDWRWMGTVGFGCSHKPLPEQRLLQGHAALGHIWNCSWISWHDSCFGCRREETDDHPLTKRLMVLLLLLVSPKGTCIASVSTRTLTQKNLFCLFGFLSTMTLKNGFSKHDMISLVQLFRRMSSPDDGFISRCDMHMETIFSFYYVVAIHLDCNLVLAIALLIHILASRCHPFLWSIVFYMVQRKDATSGWKMRYRRFLGWKWRSGIISLHGELRCSFQWLLLLCLRVAGWGLY